MSEAHPTHIPAPSSHTAVPEHGSPAWVSQVLPPHVSGPLQNTPSSHAAVLGAF